MRVKNHSTLLSLAVILSVWTALAQEPGPPPTPSPQGWRRLGDRAPAPPPEAQPNYAPAPAQALVPTTLTVPSGTWVTVRVNEPLSSDRNQPGDAFTGTLVRPIVANGIVVARRGQTVAGRVAEAQKAGHVSGTSRLGLELTEIGLVNGQQVPVHTQLIARQGDTSVGRDVAAVGTTAGVGAAIGAAAAGGFGAGMGAIAGAGAATIGVLATRGRATVVYPETAITFRLEAPLTIDTAVGTEAFAPATQNGYDAAAPAPHWGTRYTQGAPAPLPPAPAFYYSYYPYYGYPAFAPYYWGPGFLFYSGPRVYYRRWR
jgi:hypothetical protein